MTDYRLSQTQRNQVFGAAIRLGLDPTTFLWVEQENGRDQRIHQLQHLPTSSFITMNHRTIGHSSGYSLDYWPKTVSGMSLAHDWEHLYLRIERWLAAVKAESDAPDLWALAHEEREWLASDEEAFGGNTPFSALEREQIEHHLRTIAQYAVKTYNLTEAHQADVLSRLDYLSEAAKRMGRFDWKNVAASTFLQIVFTVGLDVEKARQLIDLATRLLGPLMLGAAKLLQASPGS